MKPQPFNLELWIHLNKPDIVWTRGRIKVKELQYHKNAKFRLCLSGLVEGELCLWTIKGEYYYESGMFGNKDLMLHLPENKLKNL